MKKILFLILFLTGLTPVFKNNTLDLICYQSYGQEDPWGEELEDVIICNEPDDITVDNYGSYIITETCVWSNKNGIATNDCEWNCSTVVTDVPPPDDDGSGSGSGSGSSNPCGSQVTCSTGQQLNYTTCRCECTRTCPSGYLLNVLDCECIKIECINNCGEGFVRNNDTCGCVQLPECPENAKNGILPNGKVIAIFFHGGPDGDGNVTSALGSGGTGQHFAELSIVSSIQGKNFVGEVIAPSATANPGVQQGKTIIENAYNLGDQVVIYGYSWGGDLAVDLATELKDLNIPVNLLITVDASDGPFQNSTVNTDIPDNVLINLNVYQTVHSGSSSGSNGGTSNFPGSNGGPNTAIDPLKTTVLNKNVTSNSITHGNIQSASVPKMIIDNQINNHIKGCN